MSTVFIPAVLRAERRRRQVARAAPATRSARSSRRSSSGTRRSASQLLTDDGELNRFVNVYVNGQDVRYLAGLDDAGRARATRSGSCPAMAGG